MLDPGFLSESNVQSILRESAYVGIAAAGMTLAITNGAFDLSIGGQLALITSVSLMGYAAGGTALAIIAALIGRPRVRLGQWAYHHAPPADPIRGHAGDALPLSWHHLRAHPGWAQGVALFELDSLYVKIGSADIVGIPFPFVLMIGVYAVAWIILRRTVTGRRLVAYGSSPEAARFCGIDASRLRMFVFVFVGSCVGVAALTYVTRVWTADGGTQDGYELKVIAAVVLGGTSLKGGRGTLLGTSAAVLLLAGLNDFLVSQQVPASYQRIILGAVLIIALAIDGLRTGVTHLPGFGRLGADGGR